MRVRAAGIFASGSLSTRAKMVTLQILRPVFFTRLFLVLLSFVQTGEKLKQNLSKGW